MGKFISYRHNRPWIPGCLKKAASCLQPTGSARIFPMHLTPWQADIPQLIGPQDDTNKIGQQIKLSSNLCILKIASFKSEYIMIL